MADRIAVGATMRCLRPGESEPCEAHILESRCSLGLGAGWEYYVHYRGLDRRLDDWVGRERLLAPIERRRVSGRPRGIKELVGLRASYNNLVVGPNATVSPAADNGLDERTLKAHEAETKVKNVRSVVLGGFSMDAWYYSPFPCVPEGGSCAELFLCDGCLRPHTRLRALAAHERRCAARHPPGEEVYRDGALSVFALDGARQPRYCRRLCLLAKLFLDHKVVWRETAPFAFFALCEWRPAMGCRLLGYFSKELGYCSRAHTLACLLVLPAHQRKGHGALLTGLSYELARRAGAPGTPERPLSDLGLMSYGTFWKGALLRVLGEAARAGAHLSVRDLVSRTGICEADVRETLGALGLLRASGAEHALCVTPALLAAHAPAGRRRAAPAWGPPALPLVVDPSKLVWAPRHDEGVGWAAAAPDDWSSSESDADGDADADDSEHDDAGEAAARATQAADAAAVHAAQAADAAAERALDALAAVREPATASRRRPLATGGESVNRPSQRTRSRLRMA